MERLPIETLDNAIGVYKTAIKGFEGIDDEIEDYNPILDKVTLNFLEELRGYRVAEEQGLLLRLPCKVGDTVFEISLCQAPDCNLCKGFERNDNCYPKYHGRIFDHPMYYSNIPKIGKKVFLTKEEAEQALARMEGGNEM